MKAPHSTLPCPESTVRLSIANLVFGSNGPYTLECRASECLGVSGSSGIGKTLFLRAIADLDPHGGVVTLDGRSVDDYWAPEWRRLVALVPAESRWWYQNVRAHLPVDGEPAEANELLGSLGFGPDVLDWEVGRLSTGEKQRLSVVRVLLRKPSVLLLDEIGSGLDHDNAILLERAVMHYQSQYGCPILWVSHDRRQLSRICNRLVVMKKDKLEQEPLSIDSVEPSS
jgi:ABC-type multidrug transport system ATPase subunit